VDTKSTFKQPLGRSASPCARLPNGDRGVVVYRCLVRTLADGCLFSQPFAFVFSLEIKVYLWWSQVRWNEVCV
jgi:hypothetical protein